MSTCDSATLLNKEALEDSQSRLFVRIQDLLKHHQVAIEKKLSRLESEVRASCTPDSTLGIRLEDAKKSEPPVAAGDSSIDSSQFSPERQIALPSKKAVENRPSRPLRVSLGMLPEEFQSEASGVSALSAGTSGCGSSSLGLHLTREEQPQKMAIRNRDLEIIEGQLKMAAMKTLRRKSTRFAPDGSRISNRTNRDSGGTGSAGSPKEKALEVEDGLPATLPSRERRKSTRSHRTSEKAEVVQRSNKVKRTVFAHAHDESAQLREYARKLHETRVHEAGVSSSTVGVGTVTFRQRLRHIVSSIPFEAMAGVIIISNAVLIGLEVEYMAVNRASRSPAWFQTVHLLYAIVFALELAIRILAFGWDLYFDGDLFRWACLDCFIVVTSFFDLVLAWLLRQSEEGGSISSGMSAIRVMRVLRISRLIRVTRIAKLMMWLKALRTLIHSIFVTLKSLVWALVLLALIMYVFAIILSSAAIDRLVELKDLPRDSWENHDVALESFWGSMGDAVSTLFMSITGGISWQIAEGPLQGLSLAWKVVFMAYICFVLFAVLNVMTGVFCQSAIESAARDHDMAMQNVIANKKGFMRKFRHLFHMLDTDDTGLITLVELEERMEDTDVKAYFEALELSIDDVWTFFRLLDGDDGHEIDLEEFLYGCMRLRGEAKALDLAKLMHSHAWLAKQQVDFMIFCEESFVQLQYYLTDGRSSMFAGR